MRNYCIKRIYNHRSVYLPFDDTVSTDRWQLEVYLLALGLMKKNNYQSVIDIGCGSGYKLLTYLGEYQTLGLEMPETYEWLCSKYPERAWEISNLDSEVKYSADILICADVIEHLIDPDKLLEFISKIDFKFLLISTPDRGMLYKVWEKGFWGPPLNTTHIREWNYIEFKNYIAEYFEIIEHKITNVEQATQTIICKKYC